MLGSGRRRMLGQMGGGGRIAGANDANRWALCAKSSVAAAVPTRVLLIGPGYGAACEVWSGQTRRVRMVGMYGCKKVSVMSGTLNL